MEGGWPYNLIPTSRKFHCIIPEIDSGINLYKEILYELCPLNSQPPLLPKMDMSIIQSPKDILYTKPAEIARHLGISTPKDSISSVSKTKIQNTLNPSRMNTESSLSSKLVGHINYLPWINPPHVPDYMI